MSNRLGGRQGTAYTGTNAANPPNVTYNDRDPNQYDTLNYSVGDEWINTTGLPGQQKVWKLVSLQGSNTSKGELATWILFGSTGNILTLTGNTGGAVSVDGASNINVVGDTTTITIAGNPGTNTLTASTGPTVATTYVADGPTSAVPALGILNILGDGASGIVTSAAGNTITISSTGATSATFPTDGLTATPAAGVLNIKGAAGGNITTSAPGASNTVDIAVSGTTNHAVQIGNASGSLTSVAVGVNGSVLIGATGADPAFALITSTGGSVTFTTGANTLNMEVSSTNLFPWHDVTAASQAMAVNNGYSANRGTLVTLTLPAVAAFGSRVAVVGNGAGGWLIAQNAGQTIHFNSADTTPGATGSLASTVRYNSVELLCTVANTDWVVRNASGNLTVA